MNRIALLAALIALPSLAFAQRPMVPVQSGVYSLELVDESGRVLPTFQHGGRMYTLGAEGQRYLIRVRNGSARRIEVVASVDGRDVIDGRPSALEKRGYLVPPYGEVTIDGYRTSDQSVAAFRFSSVPESYASRWGDSRDVGAIGVAIFSERPVAIPYYRPQPYRGYPSPEEQRPSSNKSAAPAPSGRPDALAERSDESERPGLGTEYGEQHFSEVVQVSFDRASPRPDTTLSLHYNDWSGLRALGIDLDPRLVSSTDDLWLRETAQPFRRDFAEAPPMLGQW